MEFQNKSKLKNFGISSIMKNDKLSKIVDEAMASPPGSTKRTKAVAMIKSLDRTTNDGMGGMEGNMNEMAFRYPGMIAPQAGVSSATATEVMPPQDASQLSPELMEQYYGAQPKKGPATIFPAAPVAEAKGMPGSGAFLVGPEKTKIDLSTIKRPTGAPEVSTISPTPEVEPEIGDFFDQWYGGLSVKDRDKWKPLYESVKAGVGAPTFAWKMMADKEKLKRMLPNIPEAELPEGASLARQVEDLDETLKKEYQIDMLRDNVQRLEERGLTVEKDLTDYVTARDEYISKLDTMIDSAKDSMLKMDLANPYVSKKMNKYMNYLYILKGRQTKRYSDYVADSINQHNLKLTRAENTYNSVSKDYENKLKIKTDITVEDYNSMREMLESMYENLDSREEEMYNLGIKEEKYLQTQYDTLKIVEDAVSGVFKKVNPKAVDDATKYLNKFIGEGGYVNIDEWIKQKQEWDRQYGAGKFEQYFSPEEWLDPNDPLAQKYYLTPLQLYKGLSGDGITDEDLIEEFEPKTY